MTKISIILLTLGCVQLIIGLVLAAANIGLLMLGLSAAVSIGIGLVFSGMITMVIGLATGIYAWKGRKEGALAAILNLAVISLLLLLITGGVIYQQVQSRNAAESVKKYEANEANERYQAAMLSHEMFQKHLWDQKVVLLEAAMISKAMGCLTVGGFKVISIPKIDRTADPADAIMLRETNHQFLRLIKELLVASAQDDLTALQAFARANATSCWLKLPSGYDDIMLDKFKLLEIKDDVLAAINKETADKQ